MHNIINEPPPTELHGRLKFTTERFVEAADITGRDVLDIGCGYGWFELWAARKLGVSENTLYRWRARHGSMKVPDVRRLKELERENVQLKKLVADQALDIAMLKEVSRGIF